MRIKYLDVLKAFAIIAVVLYHAGFMTFGYLGVDLFLVISGYLTTRGLYSKVICSNDLAGGGISYVEFETSRIIRLLPPLLIAGVFCMLLGYFVMLPDDYENLSESVIASNLFGNNILSAITTKNYWDVVNEFKPLMHTWYVGVVMQFYLIYPILFFLAKLDKRNTKGTLLTMIGTLAVISLLVYFGPVDAAKRFYYLPSRFFEFAVGGIVALTYNPKENKPFGKAFVYTCYILLLLLMSVDKEFIPANIKLVTVVALSAVLLCSQNVLENKVTGNTILAAIGAASYSIFIWHQIVLAFCRYFITSRFSVGVFALILLVTTLLSWLSFKFVEQAVTNALKTKHGKAFLYSSVASLFLALNAFAAYIYVNAGIVRDIPELDVSMQDKHRGMNAEYCDRGFSYDKPFATNKPHWLVIGDSFGRDFVNVIVESSICEQVEVSYLTRKDFAKQVNKERFSTADRVFISSSGLSEELVSEIEALYLASGKEIGNITIVGEKEFGASNGQIYVRRNTPGYFDLYIPINDYDRVVIKNKHFKSIYGERFLDMMGFVTNDKDEVRVFTPDHHFISADNRHLTKGGAKYFGELIDWNRYF